jgi:hypothetical protein
MSCERSRTRRGTLTRRCGSRRRCAGAATETGGAFEVVSCRFAAMSALGAETTRGEISIGNRRNSRRLWSRPGAPGRSRTLVPHLVGPRGVSCGAPRIKAAKKIHSSDCRRERNIAFCGGVHRSVDPSGLCKTSPEPAGPSARGIHDPLRLLSEPCLPDRFGYRRRIVTPSHVRRDRAHDPQFGRPLFANRERGA